MMELLQLDKGVAALIAFNHFFQQLILKLMHQSNADHLAQIVDGQNLLGAPLIHIRHW
jgi:hypothetical protein